MKFIEVLQNGKNDCAAACLLSIIRYYGANASIEELSLLLKTDNKGTNAYNFLCGAKALGFDGYGIKYTYEEITNNTIDFPIVVHTLKNNMYHFFVIYEANLNKKILKVMDPEVGYKKVTYDQFKNIYLGTSIVIYPVKKLIDITNNNSVFKFICEYLKLEYNNAIKIVLLSLVVIILSIASNFILKIIVDEMLINYNQGILFSILLIFLSFMSSKSIFEFVRNKILIIVNSNINLKINNRFTFHLLNLPYQFFKVKSTGEVISRFNDLKNFKEIFSNIIVNLSSDVVLIIISMITLLMLNINLFLVELVFVVLYFIIVYIYSFLLKNKIYSYQISDGEYNKTLNESIEGYESNKNINMINYVQKKLEVKYISYLNNLKDFENSYNNEVFIKNVINNLAYIISMLFGVMYINEGIMSLGDYLVFNSILVYFTEPIKNILDLEPNIRYIKGTYNRINDLLLMKSKATTNTDDKIFGNIEIKNLSYSYDNVNYLFTDVNMNIKYGSKFLIYGSSGNGKSTILKIIMKYLSDYKGSIKIGDINILDIDDSLILSSFTYASQNSYLINDTLKNNIIYNRTISEAEYEKIIKICNVDKLRDSKYFRNDFMIEDNGFNISGGERQKIVLARTLLKNANYILLDEALSEVGVNEEKEIIRNIFNYFKEKTIIYISHKKEIIDIFESKYYLERRIHNE